MEIQYSKQALKFLKKQDVPTRKRIINSINLLPAGDVKALQGRNDYRLRVGDYRIIFDINGNIALKELDDRVVGFGLEELREKEWTIAIAVGVNKVDAIIGALRAGFMNVLYTDEKTAREILNRNLLG